MKSIRESVARVTQAGTDWLSILLLLMAIALGALAAVRSFATPTVAGPRTVKNWQSLAEGANRLGDPKLPVQVLVFSDFQCPYCARFAKVVKEIERGSKPIGIAFRHFPLTQAHPFAEPAAVASECAAAQGMFEAYHNVVFAKRDSLGILSWQDYAKRAGVVDSATFANCLQSPVPKQRVAKDVAMGLLLGLSATPTIIVNGRLISGALDSTQLRALLAVK